MYFDIEELDQAHSYKLLASTVVPRPIAWVVTSDADGRCNAAPFSFFNFFSGSPPVIGIGMASRDDGPKDSLKNLRDKGTFVVNLVSEALADAMVETSQYFPFGVNELDQAGLATLPCRKIDNVRIAGSPVTLECRLFQEVAVPPNMTLVLAHVVAMHVADEAVRDKERCHIDSARLQLIGRMESPGTYTRTRDRFSLTRPSVPTTD